MVTRLCIEPKCPLFVVAGLRCSRHAAAFEANRSPRRKEYNAEVYRSVRRRLLSGAYPCNECGTWNDLTVDHLVPISRGGTNNPSNLQVLCRRCNARKGSSETR